MTLCLVYLHLSSFLFGMVCFIMTTLRTLLDTFHLTASQRNFVVVVVQLLSHFRLFATLWTAACQASLSFTTSWSLLKLMSIDLVIPSNHLILCCPFTPLALSLSQHQGLFQ